MPVPQHLQETLVIPEEDEEDREIERETQTTTPYRNDGIRCRKGQCESADQPPQSTSLSTQLDTASLGAKSIPLRLGHHLKGGSELYISKHEQTSVTLGTRH